MHKTILFITSTLLIASTAMAGGSIFGSHKTKNANPYGVYSIGLHICSSLECPPVRIVEGNCDGEHMSKHWGVCVCDEGYVAKGSICEEETPTVDCHQKIIDAGLDIDSFSVEGDNITYLEDSDLRIQEGNTVDLEGCNLTSSARIYLDQDTHLIINNLNFNIVDASSLKGAIYNMGEIKANDISINGKVVDNDRAILLINKGNTYADNITIQLSGICSKDVVLGGTSGCGGISNTGTINVSDSINVKNNAESESSRNIWTINNRLLKTGYYVYYPIYAKHITGCIQDDCKDLCGQEEMNCSEN